MSKKTNGVNYGKTVAQRSRRERVIVMLEKQLKLGTKSLTQVVNNSLIKTVTLLTESNVKRIEKELEILKSRI